MIKFFWWGFIAPSCLLLLLSVIYTVQRGMNYVCEPEKCAPANDIFSTMFERVRELLAPFTGVFVVVLLIVVVIAIMYFTLGMALNMLDPGYESEEDFVAEQDIASTDHTEVNRTQVIGWQYGLRSGTIGPDDMRTMEPAALQERLDTDNPSHARIFRLSELIELHANATDRRHIRRRDRMIKQRDVLRTHPETLHLKALSGQVREAMQEAREADRSVRELSEG